MCVRLPSTPECDAAAEEVNEMLRVFIASTSQDLADYREAAKEIILEVGCHPVMMEFFGTDAAPTLAACQDRVVSCDLLLLLLAFRRGWVPTTAEGGDGRRSVTAYEVDAATQAGKP